MPRRKRFVPQHSLIEVTGKTFQDRYLLRPGPELNRRVIGVFARAKQRYGVAIHALTVLSNHYHCLVSPGDADRLASFMNYVHSNIAHEAGRLHNWDGRFWRDRYRSIPVSDEDEAQVGRLCYLLSNGCKEGLVDRPRDWPGVHSVIALTTGSPLEGVWYDRTALSRARECGGKVTKADFAEPLALELDPLPCWVSQGLSDEEIRERVEELVGEIAREHSARRRPGVQPPHPSRLLRVHPHQRPPRVRSSPAPLVHAASQEMRQHLVAAYRAFVESFSDARRRLRSSDLELGFPEGSFPPALPFVPYRLKPKPS